MSVAANIPYEKQAGLRHCGAAALVMVLRSLGRDCSQDAIWPTISRVGLRGRRAARTYLLAQEALRHGLAAIVVQVRQPWRVIEESVRQGIRLILNHRAAPTRVSGHYTVLAELHEEEVIVHDPLR